MNTPKDDAVAPAFTAQEKEKVLKRLRKILALSQSSEAGEAAAALHQARILMDKYGLEMADAHESAVQETEITASNAEVSRWEAELANVIAIALGVGSIVSTCRPVRGLRRPKAKILFVAAAHKAELAKYAFTVLSKKMRTAMSQSFDLMLINAGVKPGALRISAKQRDIYAIAWCTAVAAKVKALAPEVPKEVASYCEKLVGHAKDEPKKAGRKKPLNIIDDPLMLHMYRQGLSDGAKVELHGAVASTATPTKLLGGS